MGGAYVANATYTLTNLADEYVVRERNITRSQVDTLVDFAKVAAERGLVRSRHDINELSRRSNEIYNLNNTVASLEHQVRQLKVELEQARAEAKSGGIARTVSGVAITTMEAQELEIHRLHETLRAFGGGKYACWIRVRPVIDGLYWAKEEGQRDPAVLLRCIGSRLYAFTATERLNEQLNEFFPGPNTLFQPAVPR